MTHETSQPTSEHTPARFVVGIDLGTTNVAVSYADCEGDGAVRQFDIPQLIHPGELGRSPLLPSFCYLPGEHELPPGALELPWEKSPANAVGIVARDQGAAVPGRLVSSAKSWLAHAGVDRTHPILPWASDIGDQKLSPVDVSFMFLDHVRKAWDREFGQLVDREGTPCLLEELQVVLTVPASFDEAARELTVQAAKKAGIENLVLIEEPLAAFYCWLWKNEAAWQKSLNENETVLVVDVGGGTTDFSLIEVEPGYTLRRTAVGDHLLLGGDNMDMKLARQAEMEWRVKLDAREWGLLCQECRKAKEILLQDNAPQTYDIAVAGAGSSVVAATRSFTFKRRQVIEALLDGFFPEIPVDAPPPERRRGIREMGLPYATDPAVTRHMLQFLRYAARALDPDQDDLVKPSRILFNGGAMLPETIRCRVTDTLGKWCGLRNPLPELHADDLNLAVSRGAAYYGRVRQGGGVKVKGGIARSYYLEVGNAPDTKRVCVMPRETDEDDVQELPNPFTLRTNQPVAFRLHSSATRLGDRLGSIIEQPDEMTPLPPLSTVLRYGKQSRLDITVQLAAKLNAIGTLDLWLQSTDSQHSYPLSFDLRTTAREETTQYTDITVDQNAIANAQRILQNMFAENGDMKTLPAMLEKCLEMKRNEWGVQLLRSLADTLIALAPKRIATTNHEARWLNLTGFTMRPGFGCAGDEWRTRELWKIWHAGPNAGKHAQVAAEWWVFWRRLAGGLRTGHQQQIAGGLVRELVTNTDRKLDPKKRNPQEAREMWRCLGALERISQKTKLKVLRCILADDKIPKPHHYWVAARTGARKLFHGPGDAVVQAAKLEPLLPGLFNAAKNQKGGRMACFAIANLCRLTGIRGVDLAEPLRREAAEILRKAAAPEEWVRHLDTVADNSAQYQNEVAGEDLPLGLTFADADNP